MKILPFNLYTTHRYVEPAFGAVVGFLIMKAVSAPLGVFIVWSAAALFLVETIAAREAKSVSEHEKVKNSGRVAGGELRRWDPFRAPVLGAG